jgi:hypothetical protein
VILALVLELGRLLAMLEVCKMVDNGIQFQIELAVIQLVLVRLY